MIRYDIQKGVQKIKTKTFLAISGLGLVLGGGAMSLSLLGNAHAVVAPQVVYSSLASTDPQTNYPSQPFQAQQTNEFGDYVHLAGTARLLNTVNLTMSNWALKSTPANVAWCASPAGSCDATGYNVPITVNIYANTLTNDVPNNKLGTKNVSVHVPWRPESDLSCADTSNGKGWKVDTTCFNFSGLAFNAPFDLSSLNLNLPNDVIVGFIYNTQSYGPAPTGVDGPYNSLNIAVPDNDPVTVGSDDSVDSTFWNTNTATYYTNTTSCLGGTFCRDTHWTPNGTVAMQITATPNTATVTIAKNLNGAPATAVSANSTSFPMESTWSATNIGSGTGNYSLGPVGFNNPNPYQATTSDMTLGATYTTHELTGSTVTTTCTVGGAPYVLRGYTTGDSLAAAESGTPTMTAPNFNSLQKDEYVVVWNSTCHIVSAPKITYPANGATKLTTQMDKVDWTNVTGAAPVTYQYQSYTNSSYTGTPAYTSPQLAVSEIPTPGTPPGNYYLQVRAQDADGNISPWSNDAAHPYVVHVVTPTTPPTTKDQCRDNGWKTFNNPSYKNKDKCIDYVVNHGHRVHGDVTYVGYSLKRSADFDMNTYDNDKGDFEYSDANHNSYKVKVSVVKVNGQDAWFAGVVTKASNHAWVGQWLFAKVHNGNTDQISGSFATQAAATTGVNSMGLPADGPFNVTKGNLKVN